MDFSISKIHLCTVICTALLCCKEKWMIVESVGVIKPAEIFVKSCFIIVSQKQHKNKTEIEKLSVSKTKYPMND